MSNAQKVIELRAKEDKLRLRYSLLIKLLFLISIIFILWILVVFVGTTILDYGYNWAGLSLEGWLYTLSGFLAIVIILDIILFLHYVSIMKKRIEAERPKPEYIDGKKVHVFTHPEGKEGGIFSKTYVQIDKHHILRLRTLMVAPEELWFKKEEKK